MIKYLLSFSFRSIYFLFTITFVFTSDTFAQCSSCAATTFTVDLSGAIDTTYNIQSLRNGDCCTGTNCVRFNITINPNSNFVNFSVANPAPNGAAYYQINCGPQTSLGTPACVSGMTNVCITYCKPGNDNPTYTLTASSLSVAITPANPVVCSSKSVTLTAIPTGGTPPYSYSWSNGQTTQSITVNSPGNYSVTVNDINNCSTASQNITVGAGLTPTTPVALNNGPLCTGQSLFLLGANFLNATYSWTGPNGFTSTAQEPVINNIALSDSGTYSVIVTVDGCSSAPGSTKVIVKPTPPSPGITSNSPLCEGQTLNLVAGNVAGATYNWVGDNGFVSNIQSPVINNVTVSSSGTYYLTATVNGCTSKKDTTIVFVNAVPPSPAANNNSPLCAGQTLNFTATAIPGAVYNWSGPNGFTSSVQNPSIINAGFINSGTYTLSATVNGCTSPVSTTTVIIKPFANKPVISSNSPVCEGDTLLFNTPFIAGMSYSWSGPNGFTSLIQNPSINNVSSIHSGIYTLTVTGCNTASDVTNVIVKPTPSISIATNNGPLCVGQTLNLTASANPATTYNWSGPNNFTSSIQNPVINNISPADAGTYIVSAIANGCASVPASTIVNVNEPAIANAGNDQSVCADKPVVNLAGTITGGSTTGMWSTNGTGTFSPNNTNLTGTYNLSNTDISSGSVSLTLTSNNTAPCQASKSSLLVTIIPSVIVNAGSDKKLCSDVNSISLNGQVTGATGGVWSTNGSGAFTPDNTALNATYIISSADRSKGNITFTLTSTGNGSCTQASDGMAITIDGPSVNAGPDRFIPEGQKVVLQTTSSGTNLQYLWTPATYLDNPIIPNPVVTAVNDQLYVLKVTDNAGCSSEDDVFIKVLRSIKVPNTFTPNNDGINDVWIIKNLEDYPDCRIQVFNRYGQLVFENKGYVKPWDGTFNGKSIPFGTYYYIIEPGSGIKPFTGYVTIIK